MKSKNVNIIDKFETQKLKNTNIILKVKKKNRNILVKVEK